MLWCPLSDLWVAVIGNQATVKSGTLPGSVSGRGTSELAPQTRRYRLSLVRSVESAESATQPPRIKQGYGRNLGFGFRNLFLHVMTLSSHHCPAYEHNSGLYLKKREAFAEASGIPRHSVN